MILLLDTDILIDFALDRAPYAQGAADLLDALEQRPGTAFVAWHSISNFYYLASPKQGKQKTKEFLLDLVRFVEVAPTTTEHLLFAGQIAMTDFEDALQVAAALACHADAVVTRNLKDYAKSPIPAVDPRTALAQLLGD